MNKTVIILSNNDWNDFWYQRQQYAVEFAKKGYQVAFVNKTLTKFPNYKSFFRGNYKSSNRGYLKNEIPENIKIITPIWLPPAKYLRPLNRMLIRRTLKGVEYENSILIIYTPTYNSLDFLDIIKPRKSVYINVHNYEASKVMGDLLQSECRIINHVDYLFADSLFNSNRIKRKLTDKSKQVLLSPPGVNIDRFKLAYRGDEKSTAKSIVFYGGIGQHLDMELYINLSMMYRVVFIGKASPEMMERIPPSIEVRPPIQNAQIGNALREFDIISILYKKNDYVDAVIPAKFFECLATGKPLLVSGMAEIGPYNDIVYEVDGSFHKAIEAIKKLPTTETEEMLKKRLDFAVSASWSKRFQRFLENIEESCL